MNRIAGEILAPEDWIFNTGESEIQVCHDVLDTCVVLETIVR